MDADQNAKLKEIFDILLSAGYFRCRIPSISIFDKILGGLTWCITCSNFDIDAQFNDEMTMGQKIKLSEKVVQILIKMSCPYKIQPHQIQGLDLKNLYPIYQWLISFVLETRDQRQDYNKSVSIFQGKKLYNKIEKPFTKAQAILNFQHSKDKRVIKNSKVDQYAINDPLRVYSSLIEFDDKTAIGTYNKLASYLANLHANLNLNSQEKKPSPVKKSAKKGEETADIGEVSIFGEAEIITDVKNEDQNFIDIRLQTKASKIGENLYKIVMENKESVTKSISNNVSEEKDEALEFASILQNENQFFEDQKTLIKRQIDKLITRVAEKKSNKKIMSQDIQVFDSKSKEINTLNKDLKEAAAVIEAKIKAGKEKVDAQRLANIEFNMKKMENLKNTRTCIKKEVKQEMQKVEEQKQKIEEEWPIYSNPLDEGLLKDYTMKKEKYQKRFKEFAELNQEIAVLQRKIENYPSAVETAQYHKRTIELFERINFEMEKYRDNFLIFNNYQDIKFCIGQHIELMKSFKEGVIGAKNKSKKEDFVKNLQEAIKGLFANLAKSGEVSNKMKAQKDKTFESYTVLLQQEREYYRLLRELQVEYEKNDYLYSVKSGDQ